MGNFVTTHPEHRPTIDFTINRNTSIELEKPYAIFVEEIMFAINEERKKRGISEYQFYRYDLYEAPENLDDVMTDKDESWNGVGWEVEMNTNPTPPPDEIPGDIQRMEFTPTAHGEQMVGDYAFIRTTIDQIYDSLNDVDEDDDPNKSGLMAVWTNQLRDKLEGALTYFTSTGYNYTHDEFLNSMIPKKTAIFLNNDTVNVYDVLQPSMQASDDTVVDDKNLVASWHLRNEHWEKLSGAVCGTLVSTDDLYVAFDNGELRKFNAKWGFPEKILGDEYYIQLPRVPSSIIKYSTSGLPDSQWMYIEAGRIYVCDSDASKELMISVFDDKNGGNEVTGYSDFEYHITTTYPDYVMNLESNTIGTSGPPDYDPVVGSGLTELGPIWTDLRQHYFDTTRPYDLMIVSNEIVCIGWIAIPAGQEWEAKSPYPCLRWIYGTYEFPEDATDMLDDSYPLSLNDYFGPSGEGVFDDSVCRTFLTKEGKWLGLQKLNRLTTSGYYGHLTEYQYYKSQAFPAPPVPIPDDEEYEWNTPFIFTDVRMSREIGDDPLDMPGCGFYSFYAQGDGRQCPYRVENRGVLALNLGAFDKVKDENKKIVLYFNAGAKFNPAPNLPSRTISIYNYNGTTPPTDPTSENDFNALGDLIGTVSIESMLIANEYYYFGKLEIDADTVEAMRVGQLLWIIGVGTEMKHRGGWDYGPPKEVYCTSDGGLLTYFGFYNFHAFVDTAY